MSDRVGISLAFVTALLPVILAPSFAHAADLPAIKVADGNQVPECATPGRLMSFLKAQNSKLDPRFEDVGVEYMRHGEDLNIRWDIAFFQMMVETASLAYTGDVKPDQNNFAGLGATGGGARGETFADVATGARAHLQHVLMYTGETVESPVAERTRNVQAWGVLTKWQKTIKGPMTYTHLAKQWAPKTRGYATDIKFFADRFYNSVCNEPDPKPELVAEARKGREQATTAVASQTPAQPSKGEEIARRAVEEARAEGAAARSGLGAGGLAGAAAKTAEASGTAKTETPAVTILNPSASAEPSAPVANPADKKGAVVETASVAGSAAAAAKAQAKADMAKSDKAAASGKCRVWQASYGGSKAVIIKAKEEHQTNYTVLDVNDGSEKREADAYITAYAKGGELMGEFTSQNQALDKAFELCPEG